MASKEKKIDMSSEFVPLFFSTLLWAEAFVLSMVVNVVSLILAPFAALQTIIFNTDEAPSWSYYLMTHDNPIDGDEGHLKRWTSNTKWGKFTRRTAWLWRNKGYRFDYEVLGLIIGNELYHRGNPKVSSEGTPGWLYQWDENAAWELYVVWRYPFYPKKCLRIRFGWKLDDLSVGTGRTMMLATSIGIWKTFRDKP